MRINSVQGTTATIADAGRSVILGTLAPGHAAVIVLVPLKQAVFRRSSTQSRPVPARPAHVRMNE
jgi:hypothetical protein